MNKIEIQTFAQLLTKPAGVKEVQELKRCCFLIRKFVMLVFTLLTKAWAGATFDPGPTDQPWYFTAFMLQVVVLAHAN